MSTETKTDAAREFMDPEGFGPDSVKLLDGKLERAAVALWLCSFNTPEDAGQMLGHKAKAWALWAPAEGSPAQLTRRAKDRHLYRRRAYLALHGKL